MTRKNENACYRREGRTAAYRGLLRHWKDWRRQQEDMAALRGFSDHQLRDIGLTASDIIRLSSR